MAENQTHKFQFINSMYLKEKYDKEGNSFKKVADDALIIAYKKDGEQLLQIIENPKFTFRVSKPGITIPNPIDNIPMDQTDSVTIYYHDLVKTLAQIGGKEDIYFNLKRDRNVPWEEKRRFENMLQMNPRLFGSDVNIEDQYKINFVSTYGVHIGGYKKMVFDIETDGRGNGVIDPHAAKDPVYCLSCYDFATKTMHVLIWDQPDRFPTFNRFKESVNTGEFENLLRNDPEMNGQFEDSIGKPTKFTNKDVKYNFEFFTEEFDLICRFYELIHSLKPDFCLAWNFTFDNLTLHNRLRHYADLDPSIHVEDIICHPNVPRKYRQLHFKEDMSPKAEYYNKWHWFQIPGHTIYLCSMAMYAHIRKSSGVLPSYALNDVCAKELKKGKHDYHDIATDVLELPYADFLTAIQYNIKDTWLLAELEAKHNDIDQIMYMAECTRVAQVTRQTAVIKNAQQMFYADKGLAMGNNINTMIDQPAMPYVGALVADPQLNTPLLTPIYSYPVKTIRPYIIDNDLTSMYPMTAISHNIYKTTLIFHLYKIGSSNPFENSPGLFEVAEVMDNYQCNQHTRWGHDYMNLPDTGQLVKALNEKLGVGK